MGNAIEVESLSKRYAVNRSGAGIGSFRDALTNGVRGLLGARRGPSPRENRAMPREYWALRDVSFSLAQGDRLGIIGANGAGKSTLLKILSRVTKPTEGTVRIKGTVASLLEVGTGFHPELSGRENIYLNGAILGMSRREISRKFDQIVSFSGVDQFLDTPVKHYSSGMYVRLAFSVAAWLEPDILIVDEVLAVGDQAFQRKCMARMQELTGEGRTVLFVSHSMSNVNSMCKQALYLQNGTVAALGSVEDITTTYTRRVLEQEAQGSWLRPQFTANNRDVHITSDVDGYAECIGGAVENVDGKVSGTLPIHKPFRLRLQYRLLRDLEFPIVPNFHLYDEEGRRFFIAMPQRSAPEARGRYTAECLVPPFTINVGRYMVGMALSSFALTSPVHFDAQYCLRFEVFEPAGVDERRHGYAGPLPGLSRPRLDWRVGLDTDGTQ